MAEEDEQFPLTKFHFKRQPLQLSVMTTAASCKTRLDAITIDRRHGDDSSFINYGKRKIFFSMVILKARYKCTQKTVSYSNTILWISLTVLTAYSRQSQ